MASKRVLVVDDDVKTVELVKLYLNRDGMSENHLVMKLMQLPVSEMKQRAESIISKIPGSESDVFLIQSEETEVQIGSGAMPLEKIASIAISIKSRDHKAEDLAREFRNGSLPIIGYIRDDKIFFDLRTIFPKDDAEFVETVKVVLGI